MTKVTATQKLNTGATIPVIALGTWESSVEEVYDAVTAALKAGYRHIDTAWIYGNEEPVGKAIRDSGIPREEIFVTTKLWLDKFHAVDEALDISLKKLGLDYVDLYLMHWPFAITSDKKLDTSIDFIKGYENLQKVDRSKAKAIGVSNFDIENLTKLLDAPTTKEVPAALQVELHVKLPQDKLVEFALSKGIVVEAYCPLGRGDLSNPKLVKIAEKHNVEVANVVLSWAIDRKTVVLPKSVTPKRIESNLTYVKLDDEDRKIINDLNKEGIERHCNFGGQVGFNTFHDDADSK